jgi:hypothetical protein
MERGEPRALGTIQRRLWRLITEPSGVEAALAAEGDADGSPLAGLIRGDRGVAPDERLDVYANAYFARVHDCLREDFPALSRALGVEAFHDLVKTYLMMQPPSRPSLRHAGARLADHLATEPFATIFARRCSYAADLARLEWAIVEAFDAADAPVLPREALAGVAPEAWWSLRFEMTPSLQRLTCAWPVQDLRDRFDREGTDTAWGDAPPLRARPTLLRVWRVDERVRHRAVSPLEHEALGIAHSGEPFGAICELAAEAVGEARAAPRAAALLWSWATDGLLVRPL